MNRSTLIAAATCAVLLSSTLMSASGRADTASDIFAGFQSKSKDPIQVDAQALEVHEENGQRVSVFSGGVTVTRGNTVMKAGTISLYSGAQGTAAAQGTATAQGTAANGFSRIEANGKIIVTSAGQSVTGSSAVVDMKTNTITVGGGVVLSQGDNVITGSRLVVNMATGTARVEQEPGKQIRGVFSAGGLTPGKPNSSAQ